MSDEKPRAQTLLGMGSQEECEELLIPDLAKLRASSLCSGLDYSLYVKLLARMEGQAERGFLQTVERIEEVRDESNDFYVMVDEYTDSSIHPVKVRKRISNGMGELSAGAVPAMRPVRRVYVTRGGAAALFAVDPADWSSESQAWAGVVSGIQSREAPGPKTFIGTKEAIQSLDALGFKSTRSDSTEASFKHVERHPHLFGGAKGPTAELWCWEELLKNFTEHGKRAKSGQPPRLVSVVGGQRFEFD